MTNCCQYTPLLGCVLYINVILDEVLKCKFYTSSITTDYEFYDNAYKHTLLSTDFESEELDLPQSFLLDVSYCISGRYMYYMEYSDI